MRDKNKWRSIKSLIIHALLHHPCPSSPSPNLLHHHILILLHHPLFHILSSLSSNHLLLPPPSSNYLSPPPPSSIQFISLPPSSYHLSPSTSTIPSFTSLSCISLPPPPHSLIFSLKGQCYEIILSWLFSSTISFLYHQASILAIRRLPKPKIVL